MLFFADCKLEKKVKSEILRRNNCLMYNDFVHKKYCLSLLGKI